MRRLTAARDVVWERPADKRGECDRKAHQPDDQNAEGADTPGNLTTRQSFGSSRANR
jgi:hypothetical protein